MDELRCAICSDLITDKPRALFIPMDHGFLTVHICENHHQGEVDRFVLEVKTKAKSFENSLHIVLKLWEKQLNENAKELTKIHKSEVELLETLEKIGEDLRELRNRISKGDDEEHLLVLAKRIMKEIREFNQKHRT